MANTFTTPPPPPPPPPSTLKYKITTSKNQFWVLNTAVTSWKKKKQIPCFNFFIKLEKLHWNSFRARLGLFRSLFSPEALKIFFFLKTHLRILMGGKQHKENSSACEKQKFWKSLVPIFRRAYAVSVSFKMKPLRKSLF